MSPGIGGADAPANVDGLIHVTRAVLAAMKERRYGRIINMTSIAGHDRSARQCVLRRDQSGGVHHDAAVRDGAGPDGITVNAVAPGIILTDLRKEGEGAEK